jgi:hypothetical protein
MRFDELVTFILNESLWPKNWLKSAPKAVTPTFKEPTEIMAVKGWLKNNREWKEVAGVHARPQYIEWLNNLKPGSIHTVSRDAVDECIRNGHTRITREGGVIHIECRNKQTGEAAFKLLQSKFSNVMGKPAVLDVLNGDSFDLDASGKTVGRTSRPLGSISGNVYTLD